jgi:TfoX/Sxy family transcriptional regulator of competence genes
MQSNRTLEEAFAGATDALPGVERRKMFGFPAIFANGNMVAGLHHAGMVMRLGETDLRQMTEHEGAAPFVAMGRTMRGWIIVPPALVADMPRLRQWLDKALAHAAEMPPKPPRKRKVAKSN